MSAAEVIREMQSQGMVLYLLGGKIKVRGDERIVSKYRPFITRNRGAVIEYLAGGASPSLSVVMAPGTLPRWRKLGCMGLFTEAAAGVYERSFFSAAVERQVYSCALETADSEVGEEDGGVHRTSACRGLRLSGEARGVFFSTHLC